MPPRSPDSMDFVMAAASQDSTRPQNTRAIMSFLREHAPFSSMDDNHLAHFALLGKRLCTRAKEKSMGAVMAIYA